MATGRPSGRPGSRQAVHSAFGLGDPPGGKRNFGSRAATGKEELRLRMTGQDRASARELRNRRDPELRLMDRQAEPRLRPRIPSFPGLRLRPECRKGGKRGCEFPIRRAANRQGFGPVGEPAGKTSKAAPAGERTPEKAARKPPVSAPPTRNRPALDASPPRQGSGAGTVGAGSDAGPHYCFWALPFQGRTAARGTRGVRAEGWRRRRFSGMS
jgi:hypothetical protein